MNVAIVDYGASNLRSLLAAFRRIGVAATVAADPRVVSEATLAVLPGVGSAASAMATLEHAGIAAALRERFIADRPTLGICLGMQLAVEHSDEDGGIACLGLAPGSAVRLRGQRVPRFGWACVEPWGDAYYFAHSFTVESTAAVATSEGLTAVIRAGAFTGVQFHPEKSGRSGERFLQRCLSAA